MMIRELSEFFGAPVLVQFRDAVALVGAGELKQYVMLGEAGEPALDITDKGVTPKGRQCFEAVEKLEVVGNERLPKYTHVVRGRLIPAPNERVYVIYESGGYVVKTAVRPSDIFAVSSIEGTLDEENRIAKP